MFDPSVRLRKAIIDGQLFIVSRLLNRYPDLLDNINPENGWSNLHYAAYHDRYEICELLLGKVRERSLTPDSGVYKPSRQNQPPKLYSQITDEDEIKLTFDHDTIIHTACSNNSHKSLELLLEYFNVCIDQRGKNGYTPSHLCCIHNFPLCLTVLLDNGAYPNIQDDDGNSPLHLALEYGSLSCVDLLLAYKADTQLLNKQGWKPEDVAYDFDVLAKYNTLKAHPPALARPANSTAHTTSVPSPLNGKISLPTIQSRKYSLSSHTSSDDETDGQFIEDANSVSTSSSIRITRDPSPVYGILNTISSSNSQVSVNDQHSTSSHSLKLSRKAPPMPIVIPSAPTPPRNGPIPTPVSMTSSHSPGSKRSSMSMRNFRSNSQTSECSPIKPQTRVPMSRPHAQSSPVVSEFIASSVGTIPHVASSTSLRSCTPTLEVDDAASKLSNFRLQNENRVKLGMKLDNMMRSQESLHEIKDETPRILRSKTEPTMDQPPKKSRILSIPIASLRSRKN
ncbi:hypothetical protein OGAPHI_001276 [Ogataea philodendri]|uniref:Target of rapamycin complex 2 subunit AVO2 n=1 Tax=Ogataea philodendri TaxID=1378263 RepID=A0A9P8T9X6_9ASCO|nr:uncharacterized protein OGAPHI_001276 [Ogataea philodendri]KAH3670760.1 hypothetical protein OGAPHI_001276 [Ogataea philodendri]